MPEAPGPAGPPVGPTGAGVADVDPALRAAATERESDVVVDAGAVQRWCEAHREPSARHWPGLTPAWVAPPAMLPAFTRPPAWRPPAQAGPADEPSLHDRLKAWFGYPLGIAVGYELELHRLLVAGDRVTTVERIADVGPERPGRLGLGRRWVIESTTTTTDGALAAVERYSMLGYEARPPAGGPTAGRGAGAGAEAPATPAGPADGDCPAAHHVEHLDVSATTVVMGAAANRVWALVHHDHRAAVAGGAAGIFLDTLTQVGVLSGVAGRAVHPDARLGRVALRMRAPIVPGDRVQLAARVVAGADADADAERDPSGVRWSDVEVDATVDGEVRSTVRARVAAPDGGDPWCLAGAAWRP